MQTLTSVVALNIQHGGGRRTPELIEWLRIQNADIVVLSEWRKNPRGSDIEAALKSSGYDVHSQDGAKSNGVLIAAKEQFKATPVTPPDAQIGVLWMARWQSGLAIIGAYFPWKGLGKKQFFRVCMEQAMQHLDAPFLLIGDLNTGSRADLEAEANPLPCAADFAALTDNGLIDLWRRQHGSTARKYTWHSRQNGFRIDHAFGNNAFQTRYPQLGCDYDHSTRESKLSDHSALILRSASSKTN